MNATLVALAGIFSELSLLAIGGGNTIIAEMHRQVVDVHHWMSAADFAALFALANAAPGPNLMICALVGWRVAGFAGASVAMAAITLPASVLTAITATLWHRFREATWRVRIQAGLVPVTVGLIAASAILVAIAANPRWTLVPITAAVLILNLRTKWHPLWLLAGGAALGIAGLG